MAANAIEIRIQTTGAEMASKVLADIAKSGASVGSIMSPAVKKAEDSLNSLGGTAKRVFEIFAGFSLAGLGFQLVDFAKRGVEELTKLGFEAQRAEESFKRMTEFVGVNGDALAAGLKAASREIVDMSDIMIASSKALAQGLNPDQITKLMEVATAKATLAGTSVAEAFNNITTAATNQQVKVLKSMGIVIDATRVYNDYAAKLGTVAAALTEEARSRAIADAIIEKSARTQDALTKGVLTNAQEVEKARAVWKDYGETIGKGFADAETAFIKQGAAFLNWAKDTGTWLDNLATKWERYKASSNLQSTGYGPGGVQNTRAIFSRPPSQDALARAASADDWMTPPGALKAVNQILAVEHALAMADLAMKGFAAGQAQGTITSAAFAAGIQVQIANLRALENQAPEVTARIQDLQTQLAALNASTFQQGLAVSLQGAQAREAALLSAVKESVAQRNITVEQGAEFEAQIHVSGLAQQRMILAQGLVDFKGTEAQKFQLLQQAAALGVQFDQAKSSERITRLMDEGRLLDLGTAGWIAHAEAIEQNDLLGLAAELSLTNDRLAEEKKALDDANAGWVALAETVIAETEQELQAIVQLNKPLRDYQDTLESIARQSRLFGRDFDALAPSISAVTAEIIRLDAAGQDVTALQEKLAGLKQVQELKGIFTDVFSSIGSAINTSITGVIMGTQTMAQAWDNLWKSIVLSFVNSGIQRLLKGLTDWLWDFLSGASSGGSGGGFLGTLVAGAGALIAKFSGSTTSALTATGTEFDAVTTSASGAAKGLDLINHGTSTLSASFSAAVSAFGLAAGIYGLTRGGSAGSMALSAAGTALSAYSLAVSISQILSNLGVIAASSVLPTIGVALAQGLAAIAPSLAASIGTALSGILPSAIVAALGGTAGAVAGGAAAATTSAAVSGLAASIGGLLGGLIALGFVAGGIQGQMADAADAVKSFEQQTAAVQYAMIEAAKATAIFVDLGTQLDSSHLVGTLHTLHDAIRDLGNLDLAVGLNQVLGGTKSQGIMDLIPGMRASVGAAWLAALDAAFKQGLNLDPSGTNAPNALRETLQAPNRLTPKGDLAVDSAVQLKDILGYMSGSADSTDQAIDILSHILEITREQAAALVPAYNDWVSGNGGAPGMTNLVGSDFWNGFMTPEHMAQLRGRGIFNPDNPGAPSSNTLDINAINRLLDSEFLTTTIRNAVVDIGSFFGINKSQMGAIGAGAGNWRGTPGAGDMPSVQAISDVQAALEAAGFVPGEYAKALEAYLISIDQNIVNNPLWKKFTDALHGTGGAADIQAALNAAIVATMTPLKFYDAAKKVTDTLTADIKAALEQQATMIDAGEDQAKIDAVGKLIDAMKAGIQAYAGLVSLFTALPGEMAAITGDLEAQTAATIAAWQVTVKALGDNVQAAQTAFDEALKGGNIIAIQQTAQQLHDATINGYNTMLKVVEQIDAATKGILDKAAVLVQMVTKVGQWEIGARGNFGTINALMTVLGGVAGIDRPGSITKGGGIDPRLMRGFTEGEPRVGIDTTRPVTATNLWAVAQALQAIISTLPAAISKLGTLDKAWWQAHGPQTAGQLQADWPAKIAGAVITAASPFLAVQQRAIDQASGGAKLDLLQQQVVDWNNLASAAIDGVNQWAQSAITGARAATDAVIAGLATERDAKLAAIDSAIEATNSQISVVDDLIAKVNDLGAAAEQMAQFIQSLKVGPLGPGNPMDKLIIAQDGFAKALQAYNAAPTSAGLSGLQGLAQTMLSLAEPIFSKPSPQFQALSATTIRQLQAAQDLAAAQASDSVVLVQQRDLLKAQLDSLNAQKTQISKDFETQTAALEADFLVQKTAIEKAATDTIDGINAGLAAALKANFDQQAPLIGAALLAQEELKAAVGDTKVWQDATLKKLEEIRRALAGALVGATTKGTEGAVSGRALEAAIGPTTLAGGTGGGPPAAGTTPAGGANPYAGYGVASGNPDLNAPGSFEAIWAQQGSGAFAWGGPNAAKLNALEGSIRAMQDQFTSMVSANAHYNSRHQIVYSHSAQEIAALRASMNVQIAAIRAQQQALIGSAPTVPTTPGTTPPASPPYVPPGPGWLSRDSAPTSGATIHLTLNIAGDVKDPEAFAEMVMDKAKTKLLPLVQADLKNGKSGVIVEQRVLSMPKR